MRPISSADADDWHSLYSDPVGMRYLGGPWALDACKRDALRQEELWQISGFGSWMIDATLDGLTHMGLGLAGFGAEKELGYNFGWIIGQKFLRLGIAHEASVAMLDWFFERYDLPVVSDADVQNEASQALMGKLGFEHATTIGTQVNMTMNRTRWNELAQKR